MGKEEKPVMSKNLRRIFDSSIVHRGPSWFCFSSRFYLCLIPEASVEDTQLDASPTPTEATLRLLYNLKD
jgi:hypothetical protein